MCCNQFQLSKFGPFTDRRSGGYKVEHGYLQWLATEIWTVESRMIILLVIACNLFLIGSNYRSDSFIFFTNSLITYYVDSVSHSMGMSNPFMIIVTRMGWNIVHQARRRCSLLCIYINNLLKYFCLHVGLRQFIPTDFCTLGLFVIRVYIYSTCTTTFNR